MTGVPSKMLTMNCSLRMTVYNPATFFGIHVSSNLVNLMYSEIAVATGQVNIFSDFSLHKNHSKKKKTWYFDLYFCVCCS